MLPIYVRMKLSAVVVFTDEASMVGEVGEYLKE